MAVIYNIMKKTVYKIYTCMKLFLLNLGIFHKIFYGVSLIVFFIVLTSSYVLYSYSLKIYEKEAIDNTSKLVGFINTNIEDNFTRVNKTFNSIMSTSSILNIPNIRKIISTKTFSDEYDELISILVMKDFFQQVTVSMNDLKGIYVYIAKDKQFVYSEDTRLKDDYSPISEQWYKNTVKANGRTLIFPPHSYFNMISSERVISYSKLLINMEDFTKEPYGVVLMDFSLNSLDRIIKNAKLGSGSSVIFFDSYGSTIYTNNSPKDKKVENQIAILIKNSKSGKATAKISGVKYLATYETSQLTGWKVAIITPYSVVTKDWRKLLIFSIILGLIAIAFTLGIAYVFSRFISSPIKRLQKGMKKVEEGNFDFELEQNSNDELGLLVLKFNNMVRNIKDLILKEYEERIARKNAEYKYLEAQINPHFIYNTLQIISSMAAVRQADEIDNVSLRLANMLRYSVNNKKNITVEDEIKNVTSYMEIQKLRFNNQLFYEIEVDKNIYKCKAMKLMLQPIVENSINHGIRGKSTNGIIRIRGFIKDKKVYLEVYDSGVGMTYEEVQALIEHINSNEGSNLEKTSSIGLRNIHMRIRMMSGVQYGLDIKSEKNEWTTVTVVIPADELSEGERM